MSASVKGLRQTIAAMGKFQKDTEKAMRRALATAAARVHSHAVRSIEKGPKTGHVYTRGPNSNLSRAHQASAPGEPPANDTGNLAESSGFQVGRDTAEVYFRANYATALEKGTRNMKPRPFLEPAVKATSKANRETFERAMNTEIRKTGK